MARKPALLLVLSAACSHTPPSIVVHAEPAEKSTALTATGSATIAVVPDCADLTLVIAADAARPADALATARAREDALVKALERSGLADKDLALSQLGVEAQLHQVGALTVRDGFRAQVTITATTRAFDQIGTLLQTAADAGVSEMSTRFRRSDLETIRKQVRTQALVAAQAKANDTAATLGIHLGRITAVSDASPSYLYANEYFPSGGGGGGLGGEQQPLTIEVTLTYEI